MLCSKSVKWWPSYGHKILIISVSLIVFSENSKDVMAAAAAHPTSIQSYWNAGSYSRGGTSAAIASPLDALSSNPAALGLLTSRGGFGGEFLRLPNDQQRWSVSMIDGSNAIIGGFLFAWNEANGSDKQQFTGSLAYKLPLAIVGGSAHVIRLENFAGNNGWHFTQSIGALAPLAYGLSIGAYAFAPYDFEKNTVLPPSGHLGVLYTYPQLLKIAFDADRRFLTSTGQDWNYSLGGDVLVHEFVALRGGHHWAHKKGESFWSSGIALIAPKIDISGFFMQTTTSSTKSGYGFDVYLKF